MFFLKFIRRRFKKNKTFIISVFIFFSTLLLVLLYKRDFDLNKQLKSSFNKRLRRFDYLKPNDFVCLNNNKNRGNTLYEDDDEISVVRKQVLILTKDNSKSELSANLTKIFKYTRIKFERSNDVNFTSRNIGLIIFENYKEYLYTKDNKRFKRYLIENNVGLMVFNIENNNEDDNKSELEIFNCTLSKDKFVEKFLHVMKLNRQTVQVNKKISKHNEQFQSLFFNRQAKSLLECSTNLIDQHIMFVNNLNNIRHVFISLTSLNHIWMLKLLFIDSIRYLSGGAISISLKRYIQIDIDDTFVAPTGTRMIPEDVYEMLRLQDELSTNYFYHNTHGFKFNLGYCGYYYQSGSMIENEADRLLIEKKDNFYWFDHTFKHLKTNFLNESSLREQFEENLKFAKLYHLPIGSNYSVTPHHSGIYPIQPNLYKLWSEMLSIQASSTECYPQVNPIYFRYACSFLVF